MNYFLVAQQNVNMAASAKIMKEVNDTYSDFFQALGVSWAHFHYRSRKMQKHRTDHLGI